MTTTEQVLAALADAPMDTDALVHELESTRRSIGQCVRQLAGRVAQNDSGQWYLVEQRSAAATPFDALLPTSAAPAGDTTAPTPRARKVGPTVRSTNPPTQPTPIAVADAASPLPLHLVDIVAGASKAERILAVLMLSGRVSRAAVERAAALVGDE